MLSFSFVHSLKQKRTSADKLTEFDEYFKEVRKKALALKNSVNDDSPDTELAEYKKQIRQMTVDIENYAEQLNDEIKDKKYKSTE